MADNRRLSERRGLIEPEETLYEGVPEHLRYLLVNWLRNQLDRLGEEILALVAARLRVYVHPNDFPSSELLEWAQGDDDDFLELINELLRALGTEFRNSSSSTTRGTELRAILQVGGSAWTVSDDDQRLEHRVDDATKAMVRRATKPEDEAADEIKQAWAHAFGKNPDPSDAWDHAIKAVEAILWPIITPNDTKSGRLGRILPAMEAAPHKWTLGLGSDDIERLASLLHLIWPNPDRHKTAGSRIPRQDEAERVVQIAVLAVNLCRGHLVEVTP